MKHDIRNLVTVCNRNTGVPYDRELVSYDRSLKLLRSPVYSHIYTTTVYDNIHYTTPIEQSATNSNVRKNRIFLYSFLESFAVVVETVDIIFTVNYYRDSFSEIVRDYLVCKINRQHESKFYACD